MYSSSGCQGGAPTSFFSLPGTLQHHRRRRRRCGNSGVVFLPECDHYPRRRVRVISPPRLLLLPAEHGSARRGRMQRDLNTRPHIATRTPTKHTVGHAYLIYVYCIRASSEVFWRGGGGGHFPSRLRAPSPSLYAITSHMEARRLFSRRRSRLLTAQVSIVASSYIPPSSECTQSRQNIPPHTAEVHRLIALVGASLASTHLFVVIFDFLLLLLLLYTHDDIIGFLLPPTFFR